MNVWVPLKRVERDPLGMTLGVASLTGDLDRVGQNELLCVVHVGGEVYRRIVFCLIIIVFGLYHGFIMSCMYL